MPLNPPSNVKRSPVAGDPFEIVLLYLSATRFALVVAVVLEQGQAILEELHDASVVNGATPLQGNGKPDVVDINNQDNLIRRFYDQDYADVGRRGHPRCIKQTST